MVEKFSEKVKKHLPWESFWASITITLVGITLVLAGIFNFYYWSTLIRLLSTLGGLVLLVLGLYAIRDSWKKM